MFAPPSSSFSRVEARELRTNEFPWRLPQLPSPERNQVQAGNACFKAIFKLIQWLGADGLPWIIEHPFSRKAWRLPKLRLLEQGSHSRTGGYHEAYWQSQQGRLTGYAAGAALSQCLLS